MTEPYIGMRMVTGKKFNKTHDKVYQAYKMNKDIVNHEMVLIAHVWELEGWNSNANLLSNIQKVTHPETISRRRRELHEAGLITYSPKAMKSRTDAFKSERDRASPVPPQIKYELMTIDGETVMKAVNDLVDSIKPQQTSLL